MSRVQRGGFNRTLHPDIESQFPDAYIGMGMTAENLAESHQISRTNQELFAASSHEKAINAQERGHFDDEIVSVGCIFGWLYAVPISKKWLN